MAALVLWYALYRIGRPRFWRVASKHPDEAYDWFVREQCWIVVDPDDADPDKPEPRSDYSGPFMLWVPKLGWKRVIIYGKHDEIEDSERRFLDQLPAH